MSTFFSALIIAEEDVLLGICCNSPALKYFCKKIELLSFSQALCWQDRQGLGV